MSFSRIRDCACAVIIPTLNESCTIGNIINKIHNLKTFQSVWIIVIDDGSTDGTIETVQDLIKKFENNILLQRKKWVLAARLYEPATYLFPPQLFSSGVYGMRLYAHPSEGTMTTPPGTLNRANANAQSGATLPRGVLYA